jgi:hypothetical protein
MQVDFGMKGGHSKRKGPDLTGLGYLVSGRV